MRSLQQAPGVPKKWREEEGLLMNPGLGDSELGPEGITERQSKGVEPPTIDSQLDRLHGREVP